MMEEPTPLQPVAEPDKNNKLPWIIGGVVAFLCCCCVVLIPVLIWLWNNGDQFIR
ncbi:hypothetical protein GW781_06895 [bacterium]|nr:hypothetical protein [bacterium]NCT20866.1 hypothetical protein [bacterium]